ncbi:MAG: 16S rRNA (uracil(1498)-N(3))-methyltransferase [Bacteroidales bacterium]|nr:16S rRNA (uracil(1498)-N(3))-methyltransferase [Bacteroidales bacterium]
MQFFYHPELSHPVFELLPDEAKHCVKALRKKAGDQIFVTDGQGRLATAQIMEASSSHCTVQIVKTEENHAIRAHSFHLAIAPTKNADRIEWLVEKSIEIGIEYISFLKCERSERQKLDLDRLQRIAVSAIKQSNTTWIPKMQIIDYKDFIINNKNISNRYIAWCDEHNHEELAQQKLKGQDVILLIGPEGDFSPEEVALAEQNGYKAIKLGPRRLRTETAGLYGLCVYAGMQID